MLGYVLACLFTFDPPETGLFTILQLKEAVVISLTATVDERPAGLNLTVEVPAQSVSPTAALLHGQQAQVCWSCRAHTHKHVRGVNSVQAQAAREEQALW